MAQAGFTPISLYFSSTAAAVPTSGNLANGELALNIADMKLYAKNSSGVVTLLASNAATTGVDSLSFGSTGLTPSTATTGAITVAGTLNVANGGTGLTTLTAGYIPFGAGTSAFGNSVNLFWDNTNARLGINTTTPASTLHVKRAAGSATITVDYNATNIGRVEANANGNMYFGLTTGSGSVSIGTTSAVDAIYVSSAGNVGIGSTSPAASTLTLTGKNLYFTTTNYVMWDTGGQYGLNSDSSTRLSFYSGNATERFRIGSSGQWGIGGATYGTAGQVFTSGGASAAPTWANAATGTVTSITVAAGTGMSGGGTVTTSGTVTLTNAGVTSIVAGTGISISGATGAVTVTSTVAGGSQAFVAFGSTGGL